MQSDYLYSLYASEGITDLFDILLPEEAPEEKGDAEEELYQEQEGEAGAEMDLDIDELIEADGDLISTEEGCVALA